MGTRPIDRRWVAAFALAVGVIAEGCDAADAGAQDGSGSGGAASVGATTSGGAVDPCADAMAWLTVPVRVHLLQSSIASFDATLDEAGFRAALDEASADWTQACVRFEVESVVDDPLTPEQEQLFEDRLAANFPDKRALLRDAMPTTNLLDPGWNVMVFPQFVGAPASGIYMGEIQSLLWAERLPPGAPPGENPPRILAHEFGHAFGLTHDASADASSNLMTAEVIQNVDTASALTDEQIETARAQVESGDSAPP
jgi:hypothetical protein